MFFRAKKSGSKGHPHEYLQIVESFRDGSSVRQRILATLGRLDQLQGAGQIDSLMQSLARFSETLRIISAAQDPKVSSCTAKSWGPALVFSRLWVGQRLPEVIAKLGEGRRFGFDLQRAGFALALQRLCEPGSDLQGSHWVQTVDCEGFEGLDLQHLYRANGFLHEVRHELERELYLRDRDLFHQKLDLLFLDTTSTYVYRDGETAYRRRGYSRDRRAELPQLVLCVAVDRRGWPVAWEVLPGNTADPHAFELVITKLRERFQIGRVIIVGDRGMISKKGIELLGGDEPFDYILGCRMRRQKEITEEVLSRAGRFHQVAPNLQVKEVTVGDRRYVVCLNPEEAQRDAADREAILAKLEETISHRGPKAVVGNKGYARFLKVSRGALTINTDAVEADRRLDGKFVLTTTTALSPSDVALAYKGLWRVERTFRKEKSTLEVRPIYHHRDETSIGHIVASFLALRLEVDLQGRLDEKGIECSWPDLMRDLNRLQAVRITLDGTPYLVRTDFEGAAHSVLKAVGVRPPSRVTRL
jgi:Transposase DDE domain